MGKVRSRKRCRAHLKSSDGKLNSPSESTGATRMEECPVDPEVVPLPNEIMKSLPVLTLAAQEKQSELPSKKKDRRQIRHQKWLQKIEVCRSKREEEKATEERRKTVVVGDMKPLGDALPQLPSLPDTSSSSKLKPTTSQQTTVLGELDHFQKVLNHPAYKTDPLEAISKHIHNAVSMGLT